MDELRSKPTEKKVEKVVSGKATAKKRGELDKVKDDVGNVWSYLVSDVLIPAAKKTLSDIVTNGIDMLLYGETRSRDKKSSASRVSYRDYYERSNGTETRSSRRGVLDYDDIIFDSRGDAEAVLSRMDEILERYEVVSVLDLYDMSDLSAPHSANKYGWKDLRYAEVVRVRGGGYQIKLPKALPLD